MKNGNIDVKSLTKVNLYSLIDEAYNDLQRDFSFDTYEYLLVLCDELDNRFQHVRPYRPDFFMTAAFGRQAAAAGAARRELVFFFFSI